VDLTPEAAIQRAQESLRNAGVDGPRREARLLVALATGAKCSLAADTQLTPEAQERLAALVARRAAREPYAYLAEEREFMGLRFTVSGAALIPRPETESLVEALLEDQPAQHVLDLGTGTGAMLLSLLNRWRSACGVGVDLSPAALVVARHNADALGLRGRALLLASDWSSALRPDPIFDLVVCNPPYIPSGEIGGLDPEVRDYEPRLALDGGRDGLEPARALLPGLVRVLAPGARVVFETDPRLWDGLAALVGQSGGTDIACLRDLTGRRRGLVARFAGTHA
jgi:release factor glutamine methyltransferase